MEIEIVTTKKKLSMSIVKQMAIANFSDIKFAMQMPSERVLGYITAFKYGKTEVSMAIIKGISDWYIYPLKELTLKSMKDRVYEENAPRDVEYYYSHQAISPSFTRTSTKSENKAQVEENISAVNKMVKFAKGLHIYL